MNNSLLNELTDWENLVAEGQVKSFDLRLKKETLYITATDRSKTQELPLPKDLQLTLQLFFYGVASIPYLSFDYTTLKSLIYAHECIINLPSQDNSPALP